MLAAISVVGILAALSRYSPALPFYWSFDAALDLAVWISGWLALPLALRLCTPLLARPLIVTSLGGYLALGVGLEAALATAGLLASALLYGRGLAALAFRTDDGGPGWSASIFVGLALLLAMLGLAIHVPINYRFIYCAVLALPALALLRPGNAAKLRQELGNRLMAGAKILDAFRCPAPSFKVLSPLRENGPADAQRIPWGHRIRFLRYALSYPSQCKSWIGLFPFMLLHHVFTGTQAVQRASLTRIAERPHAGPLYYEARRFSTWPVVTSHIQAWLARRASPANAP